MSLLDDHKKPSDEMFKQHNRRIIRMILIILAVMVTLIGSCTYVVTSQVEKAGGLDQMIIDAGKEIKDIKHEIDKHEPQS